MCNILKQVTYHDLRPLANPSTSPVRTPPSRGSKKPPPSINYLLRAETSLDVRSPVSHIKYLSFTQRYLNRQPVLV